MTKIGFEVGKSFDLNKAEPTVRKALESAPVEARQLMACATDVSTLTIYWQTNTNTMGV